jgi:hypothetical protein
VDSVTNEPIARAYEFAVSGPGTIEFVVTSSSSSGTGRFVNFVVGTDTIYKQEAPVKGELSATGVEKYSFEYTGSAANMRLIFTGGGGINLYMVSYLAQGDDPTTPEDPTPDPQPTEDNILDPALIGANTFDADYTSGIYTLVVVPGENETKPWVVDTNNAKFDVNSTTVAYTHRMKSGGANNYISVAAPEAGTLLICPRSSNKDDNERTVVVTQGSNELLNVIIADEQAVDKVFPSHVVNIPQAGEVRITNPVNAMNYYYIEFKTSTGVKHVCNLGKLAMNNNVVVATGAKTLYVYNVLGRLVRTANAQELDINDMGRGIYIVKAVYADGKAQTLKVRR